MAVFRFTMAFAALVLFATGCGKAPDSEPAPQAPGPPPAPAALPVAEAPIDRGALLLAAARAASAAALGQDDREAQRPLNGRPFAVRLRFGCDGPSTGGTPGARSWSFDEARRVLRIRVTPSIGLDTPELREILANGFEAAEGFRIARPWLLAAGCPLPVPASREKGEAGHTPAAGLLSDERFIAIAQLFTAADARVHRRDHRAYEVTMTLPAGEGPSAEGYDLVLSGRLSQAVDGRTIACRAVGPEAPPACLVSVEFDTVLIERGDDARELARWSTG